MMVQMVQDSDELSDKDKQGLVTAASMRLDPVNTAMNWRFAASSARTFSEVLGEPIPVPMQQAGTRRLVGNFSYEKGVSLDDINIALDEGAECNCVTVRALKEHIEDFNKGYAPFHDDLKIGPPQLYVADSGLQIRAFHGADARCGMLARLHVRVGRAVYPVHAVVVPSAPADLVLGLPFRMQYAMPMPDGAFYSEDYSPTWELSRLCLAVPKSYAITRDISLPHSMARRLRDAKPAECSFTQILTLTTNWHPWPIRAKPVPAAEAGRIINRLY